METTIVNIDMNNDNQESNTRTDLEEAPQESVTTIEASANDLDDDESLKSCEPEVHHSNNEKLLSIVSHDPMKCPAYTYHQITNDVTFILHVPVVKETTLVKSFEPQQVSCCLSNSWCILIISFRHLPQEKPYNTYLLWYSQRGVSSMLAGVVLMCHQRIWLSW